MSQGTIWGSRDKFGDKLVMRAQGQSSWAPRAVGATWGSAGGCRGTPGSWRWRQETLPFRYPLPHHPHPSILPSWALQCRRGLHFPSCFPADSGPLLTPGSTRPRLGPWERDQLGGRQSSCAMASPRDGTGGCAWIWAPAKSTGCPTYHNGSRT